MKANANQIAKALSAPPPDIRLFLLHGADEAGARALAVRLPRALGDDVERIDLAPATLRSDPARLTDEAAALSLFGTPRFVRVDGMGDESVAAVEALLASPTAGSPVVAIAPGVRASSKLVKLAIAAPAVMSFACYVPEGEAAEQLAAQLARELGMRVAPGVAARLIAASGGDRAVMTRELEKLGLYLDAAADRPRDLDEDALDAVGADLGEGELSSAIAAIIDGRPVEVAAELARLNAGGISPIPLLRQVVRRLITLAEMRAEIDAGATPASVIERHRIFFREKNDTLRALRRWPADRLAEAVARARAGERAVMSSANAGSVLAEQAVSAIARVAARLG